MFRSVALTLALLCAPACANAAPFVDGVNDFLPTYTGPLGRDLDVRTTEVFLDGTTLNFTATMGDTIGTTAGAFYVFGIDRGRGTSRFAIAPGVLFDSVVIVNNDGTGSVRDLIAGVTTTLAPSAITLRDRSIGALVNLSVLPSLGLRPQQLHLQPVAARGGRQSRPSPTLPPTTAMSA